mmetsp:Transcript_28895/g.47930  ORF Transcript_28895/g.47930 Transcript_28895/m.47930 type:complete len:114 (-) Transcript_28895:695-1036(-)
MCRHGNYGARHSASEKMLSILLELLKHHGGNLLGEKAARRAPSLTMQSDSRFIVRAGLHPARQLLDVGLHRALRIAPANQPLHIVDGVGGISCCLVLCRVADQSSAIVTESHP